MVLDSNGVEFLADAITFGWGCSQEFLLNEFADFINGKYQRKKDGYTSELYVHHNDMVVLRSTITLVVGGEADIIIPDDFIGNLYICGGSHTIFGSERGEINLYVYGGGCIEKELAYPSERLTESSMSAPTYPRLPVKRWRRR